MAERFGTSSMANAPGDTGYLHPTRDIQIQTSGDDYAAGTTIPIAGLRHRVYYFAELDTTNTLQTGIEGIVAAAWQNATDVDNTALQIRVTDASNGTLTVTGDSTCVGYVHIWSRG